MNSPAARLEHELILEGIVTTLNPDGTTNVSPMGPVCDRDVTAFRLRPFSTSTTYRNLKRSKTGVFHITDDVDLLVQSALGNVIEPPDLVKIASFNGSYLASACRWYAFEVTALDDSQERVEIECKVQKSGRLRDFLGWNRAMHAVLEATILATRVSFLPKTDLLRELDKLNEIVIKTASQREQTAFRKVSEYVSNYQKRVS